MNLIFEPIFFLMRWCILRILTEKNGVSPFAVTILKGFQRKNSATEMFLSDLMIFTPVPHQTRFVCGSGVFFFV